MVEGTLQRLLDGLHEGRDLVDAEYSAFSDLSRNDARTVRENWPGIPVATRATLLERALELADVNVDLQLKMHCHFVQVLLRQRVAATRVHVARHLSSSHCCCC